MRDRKLSGLSGFVPMVFMSLLAVHWAAAACGQETVKNDGRVGDGVVIRVSDNHLVAAVLNDFPPLYELDGSGHPTGFAIDIFEHVAKDAGYAVDYLVVNNWAEAMQAVRDGRADLIPGIGISASRQAEFAFTEAMETIAVSCFVRSDNYSIKGIEDLSQGYHTAVIDQSAAMTRLASVKGIQLRPYATIESALFQLMAGGVDAFVFPQPVLWKKAREIEVDQRIKVVGKPLMELKRGYLLRKSDALLLKRLNMAIHHYVLSAQYGESYQRWYGASEPFWTVRRVSWLAGAVLVLFAVAMAVWRYYTTMEMNRRLGLSHERFRAVVDHIDSLVYVVDMDSHEVLFANRHGQELWGDVVGSVCWQTIQPGYDGPCDFCSNKRLVDASGQPTGMHVWEHHNPENERWYECRDQAIRWADGQLVRMTIAMDITERRHQEQLLRESEQKYKTLVETIPQRIFVKDLNLLYVSCNEYYASDMGVTVDEIQGKTDYEFYPLDLAEKYRRDDLEVMESGQMREIEEKYFIDGKEISVQTVKTPVYDGAGEMTGVLGIFWDITERKRAEEELKSAHERLELALRGGELGMWDWDLRTMKVIRNDRMLDIPGYTPREAEETFEAYLATVHPDDVGSMQQALQNHLTGESDLYESEYRVKTQSGQWRWLLSRGRVVERSEDGAPLRVVGTNVDMTERRQIQSQREALIEQLEKKNEELERFVYTVSHDLKSPLITIRGYLGMLPEDVNNGDAQVIEDDIRRIVNATDRMKELLEDLLELSRIGRVEQECEMIDMQDLVEEAIVTVVDRNVSAQVTIDITDPLPQVYGERVRLREVFQNLIDNAVKFTRDVAAPRINIGMRSDGDEKVYFVKDNGAGIDSQYTGKVFELFQQLSAHAEGTGIGLAIVKRIIEHHQGRVWVESEGEGCGSSFCFTLGLTPGVVADSAGIDVQ